MRHIPKAEVKAILPEDWNEKSTAALEKLEGVYANDPEDKRKISKTIDGNTLWSKLRAPFAKLRNNKCWYCESIIKRSHKPIDHYRPKNAVRDCSNHGGYWWLAYDWENYRLCCTYCNSFGKEETRGVAGGKGTEFPLWEEKSRQCTRGSCAGERPLLLDPFKKADTSLLWFESNGNVIPHPTKCEDTDGYAYKKAEVSIAIYNLREDDLKECRGTLCDEIETKARNSDKYYAKYLNGDAMAYEAWEDNLEFLSKAVGKNAEYSKAVVHTLMHIRNECEMANTILEECVGG